MINPNILSSRVSAKLTNLALTSIVTEAFMNALPFERDVVFNETAKYSTYVSKVMESLHSENMLDTAISNNSGDQSAVNMLTNLKEAIESVVVPATYRIVKEATEEKKENLQEIVDKSAFTKDEVAKLVSKSDELQMKAVSDIIQKKVIDTIKDEKETYDAAEKLKADIKENLREALSDEAPTIESYMDIVLDKRDPRNPISFFSRLQDVCMESLLQTENATSAALHENISLESLLNTTIHSTVSSFDTKTLEVRDQLAILSRAVEAVENPLDESSSCDYAKKSMIMSTIITTIFETLHTLRLWTPTMQELRQFIDSPTAANTPAQNLTNTIREEIADVKSMINVPNIDTNKVTTALGCFTAVRERISKLPEAILPEKNKLLAEITEATTLLEKVITNKSIDEGVSESLDMTSTRMRESNIAELDKLARVLFRNPNTRKIQFVLESTNAGKTNNRVLVKAINGNNEMYDQNSINLQLAPCFEGLEGELRTCALLSDLTNNKSNVSIYYSDKCTEVPMFDD